jgi:hypothetical protein
MLGRDAAAPWWLIQYTARQQGWVSDQAIVIIGYTGSVPAIVGGETDGGDQLR